MPYVTRYRVQALLTIWEPEGATMESIVANHCDRNIAKSIVVKGRKVGDAETTELSVELVAIEKVE